MNFARKGIQNHVKLLLIISIIMTFFLTMLLSGIYGKQHKDCVEIDFDILNSCKYGAGVIFFLKNQASSDLTFLLNGEEKSLASKIEQEFSFNNVNKVKIEPYIQEGNKKNICIGKIKSVDVGGLIKC